MVILLELIQQLSLAKGHEHQLVLTLQYQLTPLCKLYHSLLYMEHRTVIGFYQFTIVPKTYSSYPICLLEKQAV
ncbi:unnamed protein product [Prunus brigantina]